METVIILMQDQSIVGIFSSMKKASMALKQIDFNENAVSVTLRQVGLDKMLDGLSNPQAPVMQQRKYIKRATQEQGQVKRGRGRPKKVVPETVAPVAPGQAPEQAHVPVAQEQASKGKGKGKGKKDKIK
jgi:hypothetical protein